jgi:hypothetical protein
MLVRRDSTVSAKAGRYAAPGSGRLGGGVRPAISRLGVDQFRVLQLADERQRVPAAGSRMSPRGSFGFG